MVETPIDTALDAAAAAKASADITAQIAPGKDAPATLPSTPYAVSSNPSAALGGTAIGIGLILVTGTTTLLGFVKAGSIMAAAEWLQSVPGVAYLAALGLVATAGWRLANRYHLNLLASTLEPFAPKEVAKKA